MEGKIEEFVTNYFLGLNPDKDLDRFELLKRDYFAAALIDSFGAIEMIGAIEEEFGIEFEFTDFEQPEFKIVEGLIGIIRSKLPN
jgi:acyl carrier protein